MYEWKECRDRAHENLECGRDDCPFIAAGRLIEDRVCRVCNGHIGNQTETQFLRAGPIAFFRWMVGTGPLCTKGSHSSRHPQ